MLVPLQHAAWSLQQSSSTGLQKSDNRQPSNNNERKRKASHSAKIKILDYITLTDGLRNQTLITGRRNGTEAGSRKRTSDVVKNESVSERGANGVRRLQHVASERLKFPELKSLETLVEAVSSVAANHWPSLLRRRRDWGRHWISDRCHQVSNGGLMSFKRHMLCNIINIMRSGSVNLTSVKEECIRMRHELKVDLTTCSMRWDEFLLEDVQNNGLSTKGLLEEI